MLKIIELADKIQKLNQTLSNAIEAVGIASLLFIMVITCADVIGAKVFLKSVPGALDIVMLAQTVAISFSVAATLIAGGHVSVEIFVMRMAPWILFMLGMPVAFAMAFIGLAGFAVLNGLESTLALLSTDIFDSFSSYTLSVIPMFILMGSFAYAAGISGRLYRTNYVWLGSMRGGLTIAILWRLAPGLPPSAVLRPQPWQQWGALLCPK
jgi:TRAP-type C4-dicarboxylate transport system permease small subunit